MFDTSWHLNMTCLSVSHKSQGGPKQFGEQLKKFRTFSTFFYSSDMEDFWEESTMFNCHQNKMENTAWPKEMTCSKRTKLKQDFKIYYPVNLKINKDSPIIEGVNVFKLSLSLCNKHVEARNLFPTETEDYTWSKEKLILVKQQIILLIF